MSASSPDAPPSAVLVAVPTFRRPVELRAALAGVNRQVVPVDVRCAVVVVDNDPDGGARALAEELGCRYVHEPRPGLAAVRNSALDAAADADALVFLDDDELPREGWLAALVDTWRSIGCDAVSGVTLRVLEGDADAWVRASGFFDLRPRELDRTLPACGTGNLLLDMRTVRRLGLSFDERFRFSGGEDSVFTRALVRGGGVIRWCPGAVVDEPVPASRSTREWVLARELRTGNSWSRVQLSVKPSARARLARRLWLLAHASVIALRGVARLAAGVLRFSLALRAQGTRELSRARGVAGGALGSTVEEYGRQG